MSSAFWEWDGKWHLYCGGGWALWQRGLWAPLPPGRWFIRGLLQMPVEFRAVSDMLQDVFFFKWPYLIQLLSGVQRSEQFACTLQPPHPCRGWNAQRWTLRPGSTSLNQDDLLTRDKHLRCEASKGQQVCQERCHLGSRAQRLLSSCWSENDGTKAAESHGRECADLTQEAIFQVLEIKRVAWGSWWGTAQGADAFSVWAQNDLSCESWRLWQVTAKDFLFSLCTIYSLLYSGKCTHSRSCPACKFTKSYAIGHMLKRL